MATITEQKIKRFQLAAYAIVETLVKSEDTVREGPLYAALMSQGFSHSEFKNVLLPLIVESGLAVRTSAFGLVATDKGRELVDSVRAA